MLKDFRSHDCDWCVIVIIIKKGGPIRVIICKQVVIGKFQRLRRSCNVGAGSVTVVDCDCDLDKVRCVLCVYFELVPPVPLVQYCCSCAI